MTRQVNHRATCPECGAAVDTFTPFSHWLRGLTGPLSSEAIDNQNLDYIWHNYRQGWFITLEEKRYSGHSTIAQQDTHGVIAQMLAKASGSVVKTIRGHSPREYRGHYVIVFEKTTPDDSAWIKINGQLAGRAGLLRLLSTGRLEVAARETATSGTRERSSGR